MPELIRFDNTAVEHSTESIRPQGKTDRQQIQEILQRMDGRYRENGLDIVTDSGVRFVFNAYGMLCAVKPTG